MDNKLPEIFEEFAEARKNGFLKVKKIKDEGGHVVGTFCTYTPREIIFAAGAYPVSLCATSEETIPDAEKDLPKNLCPLVKASYGFAVSDKCPYMYYSDMVVAETTCDGKKKMYEFLGKIKDVHLMQLPQRQDLPSSKELWRSEMLRLIEALEAKFGVKITEERLRDAIRQLNEERKHIIDFYNLGKLVPPPISGYSIIQTLNGATFSFDKAEQNAKLETMIKELTEMHEKGEGPIPKEAKRILITGCPMAGVMDKVVKTIEDLGAVVVCYENCVGTKSHANFVDETIDPVDAIAERYLKINCSVMSPNSGRINDLYGYIDDFKVDGVVEIVLSACHTFNIESENIRKAVQDKGLPYIKLETDYSISDKGQIATRLGAFLEMM